MKKIIFGLYAFVLFFSCSDDKLEENLDSNTNNVVIDDLVFNYSTLSDEDKIKVIVGEAVSNYLITNPNFNNKLFSKLVTSENKTIEFLYIKEKDLIFSNGKSFENLLLDYYSNDNSKKELILSINTKLPSLVIKIPEWVEFVLGNNNLELEFAVYPCLSSHKSTIHFRNGQINQNKSTSTGSISEYLPIQVEESERLIPVNKNSNITFWNNDFYADNFPFLQACSSFNRSSYTVHSNETYDFIDKIDLNYDLVNGVICTIPNLPPAPLNDPCNIVYERDCRNEKNVIEGLKLSNLATFIGINNQPGGEDVMSLHYNFVVASMCGDLMQNAFCPPDNWKLVFFGRFFDFFILQLHYGTPIQSEYPNVYFEGNGYYLKAFPKYYDIPIDMSAESIYSQARYLPLSPNGTWDGNKYGDAISLAIYEHDDVTVGVSQTNTISVTNTTKVSLGLTAGTGTVFTAGADFSNSTTRTTSTTITIDASKDVELGKTATNYYEQNFTNPNIGFGYNVTTGAVNTHFAFYY